MGGGSRGVLGRILFTINYWMMGGTGEDIVYLKLLDGGRRIKGCTGEDIVYLKPLNDGRRITSRWCTGEENIISFITFHFITFHCIRESE